MPERPDARCGAKASIHESVLQRVPSAALPTAGGAPGCQLGDGHGHAHRTVWPVTIRGVDLRCVIGWSQLGGAVTVSLERVVCEGESLEEAWLSCEDCGSDATLMHTPADEPCDFCGGRMLVVVVGGARPPVMTVPAPGARIEFDTSKVALLEPEKAREYTLSAIRGWLDQAEQITPEGILVFAENYAAGGRADNPARVLVDRLAQLAERLNVGKRRFEGASDACEEVEHELRALARTVDVPAAVSETDPVMLAGAARMWEMGWRNECQQVADLRERLEGAHERASAAEAQVIALREEAAERDVADDLDQARARLKAEHEHEEEGTLREGLYVVFDGPPGPGAHVGALRDDLLSRLGPVVDVFLPGSGARRAIEEAISQLSMVAGQFVDLEDETGSNVAGSGLAWHEYPGKPGLRRLGPFALPTSEPATGRFDLSQPELRARCARDIAAALDPERTNTKLHRYLATWVHGEISRPDDAEESPIGLVPYMPMHSHGIEEECGSWCPARMWRAHIDERGNPYDVLVSQRRVIERLRTDLDEARGGRKPPMPYPTGAMLNDVWETDGRRFTVVGWDEETPGEDPRDRLLHLRAGDGFAKIPVGRLLRDYMLILRDGKSFPPPERPYSGRLVAPAPDAERRGSAPEASSPSRARVREAQEKAVIAALEREQQLETRMSPLRERRARRLVDEVLDRCMEELPARTADAVEETIAEVISDMLGAADGSSEATAAVLSLLWERGLLVSPEDDGSAGFRTRATLRVCEERLREVHHHTEQDGMCPDCLARVMESLALIRDTLDNTNPFVGGGS